MQAVCVWKMICALLKTKVKFKTNMLLMFDLNFYLETFLFPVINQ